MNQSIKFKDNKYLDSTGIVHNKKILSIILENKQDKWQTIWEGSATTGNTISTGVDFTNIKGIRFKDNKSNCWHEAKIKDFLNKQQIRWSITLIDTNSNVLKWYDLGLNMADKDTGKINVTNASYAYEYFTQATITLNNTAYSNIQEIQIKY